MYREPNKKSDNDSPELASCNAVRQKQDTFRAVMMCQGFLAMMIFFVLQHGWFWRWFKRFNNSYQGTWFYWENHGGYLYLEPHPRGNCLDFPEVVCIKRDMAAVRSRFDQQAGSWSWSFFFGVSFLPFFMLNLKRRIILANLKELDAVSSLDCQFEFEHSSRCQVNDIKSLQRMLHSFERQGRFPQKIRRAAKRATKNIKKHVAQAWWWPQQSWKVERWLS